jgi:hypothetical protein
VWINKKKVFSSLRINSFEPRSRCVLVGASARILRLESKSSSMLKIESSPKATGHTEKEPIGDSQPTFNRVLLETKGVNRIGQNEP